MSIRSVKVEDKAIKDMNWEALIKHCKAEISSHREKIKTLSKSLFFFEKQAHSGVPLPLKKEDRHDELS
jgi:hypothetical protein